MNKKLLFTSIIIAVVVIAFGLFIVKYSFDPFGAPPKGASLNCGPENRYKFDIIINSKEDFVNFLKTSDGKILNQYSKNKVQLDNFKNITFIVVNNHTEMTFTEPNWNKVLSEAKTENAGFKTIYVLNYNPFGCSGFTLKMTTDGHVSVYGCCGM